MQINYISITDSISLINACISMQIVENNNLKLEFFNNKIKYYKKLNNKTLTWVTITNESFTFIEIIGHKSHVVKINEKIYDSKGQLVNDFTSQIILDRESNIFIRNIEAECIAKYDVTGIVVNQTEDINEYINAWKRFVN